MTVKVLKPGLATTVQDLGRPGYYHIGIPLSGGMDRHALVAANLLVGNEAGAAVLEAVFMSDAVRLISISRGYDPRDFALVAFGGAGALHGVDVARELAIPVVIVPLNPGVTSALGCLLVDMAECCDRARCASAPGR